MRRIVLIVSCIVFASPTAVASAEAGKTWYVSASAPSGGDGTQALPFDSLDAVSQASKPGDTILVLPSDKALDGGIQLKADQTLAASGSPAATLANTTKQLDGDAVRLADGATVKGLRFANVTRGAVYGLDSTDVTVTGNDLSAFNTGCSKGFLIPKFNLPTNVPGVGAPIPGLQNGWAGIQIDSSKQADGTATITDNVIHDAKCGDGIDVRMSGTASYEVSIVGNTIRDLKQGPPPGFLSLLAIGLQTADSSSLTASVVDNSQANLGPTAPIALGADSEGVFVQGSGPSTIAATVVRNRYVNTMGGFSANGLEMATMGAGTTATVSVKDSTFSGAPGDLIEEAGLGSDARMTMRLERVVLEKSTGIGNTVLIPANNGDCLVAGSLGARNDIRLTVRDSVLRDCKNNGLSIGSNVVNGRGPTKNISVDVDNSTITGNRGGNIGIRNFTKLDQLSFKVQRSNLAGSKALGSMVSDIALEDLGKTTKAAIDFGGGSLGSVGQNCARGGLFAADVVRYRVSARHNWWGKPGGPGPLRTIRLGGSLDTSDPLAVKPSHC